MRAYSEEALAALRAGNALVTGAVWFAIPGDAVGFWGGYGNLSIGAYDFVGLGDRGIVKTSSGTLGGAEEVALLELSGVDPDVAAELDLMSLRGVPVIIWRLLFNGAGTQLLQASVHRRGRVDSAPIEETPAGTSIIKIGVEGAARGLGRRSERMRSDADQRLISATDGGFRRVGFAGEKTIYWGGKPPERAGTALGGTSAGSSTSGYTGSGYGGGGGIMREQF
ncbi:MAG: hypothetical protein JHC81_04905 [Brevundimonas sp.]|uniref:hypothetical protein n=1 Tax=Brevundimonas sp. TaxID=1871086 RepID=UPI001A1F3A70|nr:hypothetical protein [Brevundimonas sp.]MBJ7446854.1 hypothetical protein [Brevundimonas sp.]